MNKKKRAQLNINGLEPAHGICFALREGAALSIGLVFGEQAINEWKNKSGKLKAIFLLLKNITSLYRGRIKVGAIPKGGIPC